MISFAYWAVRDDPLGAAATGISIREVRAHLRLGCRVANSSAEGRGVNADQAWTGVIHCLFGST